MADEGQPRPRRFPAPTPAARRTTSRRCTNCSASSAIRSARSNAAIADKPRLRHGACAEGLSLRPLHRPRGDGRSRSACHEAASRPAGDARASAAMSQRSAISPRAAGTRPAACWRTSPIDEPRDALALQAGHQIDFFTGNSRMLRDRIARAMPAWSEGMPGYHATLGMQAFGLEEMGDYARAEALGRKADRARAARRLGAACGRACDGDAVPPARRHRLDARTTPRPGRRRASSRCTIGGIWRCSTTSSARSTRCWRCSTGRSTARARRWRSTCSTPRRCSGGCISRRRCRRPLGRACRQLGAQGQATATTPSTTCTP